MKKIIPFIILIFLVQIAISQKVTVVDQTTLKPIEGTEIFNLASNHSALTNSAGEANLDVFKPDELMTFRHLSYLPVVVNMQELKSKGMIVALKMKTIDLDEVVFSANKVEERKSEIPQRIEVIKARELEFNLPQTSGDLLVQTGKVYLQESQMGGGSPVLRGFEANKVLLVVDGVRMNNAIYRSGHLQNVLTIDPNALERVEVINGPGSVIYGSDALGGVMHFFTKQPKFSTTGKLTAHVEAMTRYASVNNEKTGSLSLEFGLTKWSFLTNVTYKDLGDLKMGTNRDPFYGDWGKCLYYAERINGKDSMVTNADPLLQKNTGYHQYDILQKILFKASDKVVFTANFQLSNSGDVPRYDRLQQFDKGLPVYSEWYYGPQKRLLSSLNALLTKGSWYDQISLTGAYQNIGEDRISRKFGKKSKKSQEERVDVLSFNADAMKKIGTANELRFGLEATHNSVNSTAYNTNIETGKITYDAVSRYPDNGNTMTSLAGYITHNWEISKKLFFPQGIRFSAISLTTAYTDTMMALTKFPFEKETSISNSAINGNIGVVYMPGYGFRFSLMGSSGFRAPNVDDIGKVNDSKAGSFIVIPNPDLKPEYANNIELTIGKTFDKTIHLEATAFYTKLKDAMVVKAFTLNGADSVEFDGKMSAVQAAQNVGEAYIYGLQGNMLAQVTDNFTIQSTLTYTYGRVKDGEIETPLDHIPPLYGMTSFKLKIKSFEGDFYIRYNGWKMLSDYSSSGEDNLANATALGNPGWYTLNLKTSLYFNKYLSLQLGIENLTDRYYRNFASGISGPGRNFIVALRGSF